MYNELLDTTANYDIHANATDAVLSSVATVTAHENTDPVIETSRIDAGEASCIELVNSDNAAFFYHRRLASASRTPPPGVSDSRRTESYRRTRAT
jgi:hypothetical protein